jgi:hypothetical protein
MQFSAECPDKLGFPPQKSMDSGLADRCLIKPVWPDKTGKIASLFFKLSLSSQAIVRRLAG